MAADTLVTRDGVAPEAGAPAERIVHWRAYKPQPVAPSERDAATVLFGGLQWRTERLIQGALQRFGVRTEVLPTATRADLLAGRELADIGQCCPTSFTTGNLANFLRERTQALGSDEVVKRFVHLTAGSCGSCRFGQYHQSYELALRNIGLESFRMFLLQQNQLEQDGGHGLPITPQVVVALLWAVMVADLLQDVEYQIRPYEVEAGATDRAVRAAVAELHEAFAAAPAPGGERAGVAWFALTGHFSRALQRAWRHFEAIEVDRLRVKPIVKITGEFYLQTVEGDPNYNIHRWLEAEGAEVYPAAITIWIDYLLRLSAQDFEDRAGLRPGARTKRLLVRACQGLLRGNYARMAKALGGMPHALPRQEELCELAAPYYHSRLNGGEGDMLVGKSLWAHQHRKAHMVCELSPYSCMPNTMSIGAMAAVIGAHPDLLYAPVEIKGDAEVHALSRCQMILHEARRRAQAEFDGVLARTGLTLAQARERLARHPHLRRAGARIPHRGVAGTAANLVLHVATLP
jgi:predicted nucleotide-binding protein (sugar kinase/HSP70/actin superfamily)